MSLFFYKMRKIGASFIRGTVKVYRFLARGPASSNSKEDAAFSSSTIRALNECLLDLLFMPLNTLVLPVSTNSLISPALRVTPHTSVNCFQPQTVSSGHLAIFSRIMSCRALHLEQVSVGRSS